MSKRIIISHHYKDQQKIHLLRAQLRDSVEIALLPEPQHHLNSKSIQESILEQIRTSSMVLVMLGDDWSQWQEYEVTQAIVSAVPVIGLRPGPSTEITPQIFKTADLRIIDWKWSHLSEILAGEAKTVSFEEKNEDLFENSVLQIHFAEIAEKLTTYILCNPRAIHDISPRQFEELVAYLMKKNGYEVTLTQRSRDGGVDIFAVKHDAFGRFLTIVDCKKYSAHRPVGIDIVRGMYGTLHIENASHGIIATTSRFTSGAKQFSQEHQYQISLKDQADILHWIMQTKS